MPHESGGGFLRGSIAGHKVCVPRVTARLATMRPTPRRSIQRRLRRLSQPAVALVLVLAQAVAVFGFPLVSGQGVRGGNCGACGGTVAADCRCGAGACSLTPAAAPESCGSCGRQVGACCHSDPVLPCCAKSNPAAPAAVKVVWVPAWKAQQCRGEGPLGLFAELPAVPPAIPAGPNLVPAPVGLARTANSHLTSRSLVPFDPPPRSC